MEYFSQKCQFCHHLITIMSLQKCKTLFILKTIEFYEYNNLRDATNMLVMYFSVLVILTEWEWLFSQYWQLKWYKTHYFK